MSLHKDAVNSLAAAGIFNVDLESPKYADFVATRLSGKERSYTPDDPYVQEVVEYSRRPEVIDEAVNLIGGFGSEVGRKYHKKELRFDVEPLKEDLKRTFGKKHMRGT